MVTQLIANDNVAVAGGGSTWAAAFIGDGTTLPSGNTFGLKYLCFYLEGSTYSSTPGTFPIPGGSYGFVAGSNVTGGLTLSNYYRDRWFYGTFGAGENETDGSVWTKEGPLLAARLSVGMTLASGGSTFHRETFFGKGFHGISGNGSVLAGVQTHQIINQEILTYDDQGIGYRTYKHVSPIIPFLVGDPSLRSFADNVAWNAEKGTNGGSNSSYFIKPFTLPSFQHLPRLWNAPRLGCPPFLVLPFDNSQTSSIVEPYSNKFVSSSLYFDTVSLNGITNSAHNTLRTATEYRNMTNIVPQVSWTGSGITQGVSFPLRAVIDTFSGITGASRKGMILMFALAQPVSGITTGVLSTWHVGITHGSTLYTAAGLNNVGVTYNISNINGLGILDNGAGSTAEIINPEYYDESNEWWNFSGNQLMHGISSEYDCSSTIQAQGHINTTIAEGLGVPGVNVLQNRNYDLTSSEIATNTFKAGSQGIPLKESDAILATLKDFAITKTDPSTTV
jgi:hypothetical protein